MILWSGICFENLRSLQFLHSSNIPCIFVTCEVHYHVQKSLPLVCFQDHVNLCHTLLSCLLKIHFNIICPIHTSAFQVICVITCELLKCHVLGPLPICTLQYVGVFICFFFCLTDTNILLFDGYKYIIV